jgi:Tfp pilus assembly protein PilP
MRLLVLLALVTTAAALPSVARAQTPAAGAVKPAVPPATAAPSGPASSTPPQPEPYVYNPEARRDPFLSLLGSGGDTRGSAPSRRGDGAAGMLVAEVSVRGVLQSRGELVAMIQGPDNKTYIVRKGDKLLDGTIKSVTAQGLIVVQEVNDPLSLVKQREVPKLLRSLEVGRQ